MLPTFMILGAAKAGTTSLYYYLSQHSDIYMSHPKEPRFFWWEYERGTDFYLRKYFKGYKGQKQVGEAAVKNLYLPYVPQRVAETLNEPRFIVMVRNPVDRAFSHYWYEYTRGDQRHTFEEALAKNVERLAHGPHFNTAQEYLAVMEKYGSTPDHPTYIDSGYYTQQIQRYIDMFGLQRMKIVFFEDLVNKTVETVNSIVEYLGLALEPIADLSAQNRPVPSFVSKLFRMIGPIPGVALFPPHWRDGVKRVIRGRFAQEKPKMTNDTRRWLVEHYRPHNEKLAAMTGRDLSGWDVVKGKTDDLVVAGQGE